MRSIVIEGAIRIQGGSEMIESAVGQERGERSSDCFGRLYFSESLGSGGEGEHRNNRKMIYELPMVLSDEHGALLIGRGHHRLVKMQKKIFSRLREDPWWSWRAFLVGVAVLTGEGAAEEGVPEEILIEGGNGADFPGRVGEIFRFYSTGVVDEARENAPWLCETIRLGRLGEFREARRGRVAAPPAVISQRASIRGSVGRASEIRG